VVNIALLVTPVLHRATMWAERPGRHHGYQRKPVSARAWATRSAAQSLL